MLYVEQISTALSMLYYNWLAVYLKTTKFQLLTRRYFPLLAVALFSVMTVMVLQPTLNIKSSRAEQWCQYVHTDIQSRCVVNISKTHISVLSSLSLSCISV